MSPHIPCVNLRLTVAVFETTSQLLILASLHQHNIEQLSIAHPVMVNGTPVGIFTNVDLTTNSVIFYLYRPFPSKKL